MNVNINIDKEIRYAYVYLCIYIYIYVESHDQDEGLVMGGFFGSGGFAAPIAELHLNAKVWEFRVWGLGFRSLGV